MREKYAAALKFMEERKQPILTVQAQYQQQPVLKLIGIDQEPKHVSEGHAIFATNKSVMRIYYYQKMYTSFIFRSYNETKENAEKYLTCIGNSWANLFLAHAFHAFHAGLISFWLARKSREEQGWYLRGNKSKLALKIWTESSRWVHYMLWRNRYSDRLQDYDTQFSLLYHRSPC